MGEGGVWVFEIVFEIVFGLLVTFWLHPALLGRDVHPKMPDETKKCRMKQKTKNQNNPQNADLKNPNPP